MFCLSGLFLFFANIVFGQNEKPSFQMYSIHEDHVNPDMIVKYEELSKKLSGMLKEHQISDVNYMAASTDELTYMFVSPITSLGDLDRDYFKSLSEKVGKEKLSELFGEMDKCYDAHGNYIVVHRPDLSYTAEGINRDEMNYRVWVTYDVHPSNWKEMMTLAKEWKATHMEKGTQVSYNFYTSGFGQMGPKIIIARAAKDPVHYAQMGADMKALLGESTKDLSMRSVKLMQSMSEVTGWMRPDLGYMPESAEVDASQQMEEMKE
jgi:hypothetical protein